MGIDHEGKVRFGHNGRPLSRPPGAQAQAAHGAQGGPRAPLHCPLPAKPNKSGVVYGVKQSTPPHCPASGSKMVTPNGAIGVATHEAAQQVGIAKPMGRASSLQIKLWGLATHMYYKH